MTCPPFPRRIQRVLHSCLSGRVILHIREAVANGVYDPSRTLSNITDAGFAQDLGGDGRETQSGASGQA